MSLAAKLLSASGGVDKLYVDDVFSAWPYTGNGATQTITNGIDLAGKGGMVWLKPRSGTYGTLGHALFDTVRGGGSKLVTNTTAAESVSGNTVPSFAANGFNLDSTAYNASGEPAGCYASWTFRNADKFFTHTQVVKSSGSNATVNLSSLGVVGMVKVKRTDAAGSWYVWHRSLSAGQLLIGESTAAAATLGQITVSGTTLTLVNGVIADGTYHIEAYAHDTSADGLIQCGSFTTDGSGNATVNLGWEPQYVMCKAASGTGAVTNWITFDSARNMVAGGGGNSSWLYPNTSGAEASSAAYSIKPTATGMTPVQEASTTYIYLAIRRPNKPPTSGTQVYNAIARTGTGSAASITGVGFAPDLQIFQARNLAYGAFAVDRLRGAPAMLQTATTDVENVNENMVSALNMDGSTLGAGIFVNSSGQSYINHFLKRAVGVFDEVCYTGTSANQSISHNLTVVPELVINKNRDSTFGWYTTFNHTGSVFDQAVLNTTAAANLATAYSSSTFYSSQPTATVLPLGASGANNVSPRTYVAYLFATKAGISKVGSYTGNGTSQTIDCGFTTGARFFLVKATSTTGNWWIFDSVRGIISAADPTLALNSTAAEITSVDAVDPSSVGLIVNQEATCSINASGVSYIYLSFS
jgi:hypothetical protein